MPTRDLANKRIALFYGTENSVSNVDAPTKAEIDLMLFVTPSARFDGYELGMQASDRTDDRTLDDNAGAQLRSFDAFGGSVAHLWPKKKDKTSILRKTFDLLRAKNAVITAVERVGWKGGRDSIEPGDNVNLYVVTAGGFTPDTEGDGGYAYSVNLLPKGDVAAWVVVPADPAAALTATGGALTVDLTVGKAALRGIKYLGNDITGRAEWSTSDGDIVSAAKGGVIFGLAEGTADVTVTYPGAAAPLVFTVTVAP